MASIYTSPAGEDAVMALYNAVLTRWPVPYTTMHLPTRHGTTFVISSGDHTDPPLVLLHGAGTNATRWRDPSASRRWCCSAQVASFPTSGRLWLVRSHC